MIGIVEDRAKEIGQICSRYRVRRLDLFGSAARGEFDPATSDLDFLVEFLPLQPCEHANAYFGLLEDLEALFGCRVDLLVKGAVANHYLLESIEASRIMLYPIPSQ